MWKAGCIREQDLNCSIDENKKSVLLNVRVMSNLSASRSYTSETPAATTELGFLKVFLGCSCTTYGPCVNL